MAAGLGAGGVAYVGAARVLDVRELEAVRLLRGR
jgi:hypothetical protein